MRGYGYGFCCQCILSRSRDRLRKKGGTVAPVTASYTIVTRPGTIRRGSVSVCHVLLETIHWSQPGPLVPALHC